MKIVIALGGNALGNTPQEQIEKVADTAKNIVDLVQEGHQVIIGHGNGPQVGMIKLAFTNVEMPFTECGAMSQGYIGYHLQQAIRNELRTREMNNEVATVLTQVIIDPNDEAFNSPSKPVGSFYTKEQVEQMNTSDTYIEDAGRGYRKVIASPKPQQIVELPVIKQLVENNNITITVGGGGIPVTLQDNQLKGVEAVIDKDYSSSLLAQSLNADRLIILTAVNKVAINFNKPNQQDLDTVNSHELEQLISEGHFLKGSMLEKVIACKQFVENNPQGQAIITSLENAKNALNGLGGTIIVN